MLPLNPHFWFQVSIALLLVLICRANAMKSHDKTNDSSSRVLAESSDNTNTTESSDKTNTILIVAIFGVVLLIGLVVLVIFQRRMFRTERAKDQAQKEQGATQVEHSDDESVAAQTNFKPSPTAKIIKHDQTITEGSLYTTTPDECQSFYGMEEGINNSRMIMIDGISVLSFIEGAQNAYDDLVPETNNRHNYYHEQSRKQNVVIDGASFETMDYNDQTFISIYSMDEFYPDDDEVANYGTVPKPLSEEKLVRGPEEEMSILYTIDEVDSKNDSSASFHV